MESIARDETEHPALAWDTAEWFDRLLDDDARARVTRSRAEALAVLRASLGAAFLSPELGLPTAHEAGGLLAQLDNKLDWKGAAQRRELCGDATRGASTKFVELDLA